MEGTLVWIRDRVLHLPSKLEGFIVMLQLSPDRKYGVELEMEEGNHLLYPIKEEHLEVLERHEYNISQGL
jgi:hypothetical protein